MRFEYYEDRQDDWRWTLIAANGRTIADSGEGYRGGPGRRVSIKLRVSRLPPLARPKLRHPLTLGNLVKPVGDNPLQAVAVVNEPLKYSIIIVYRGRRVSHRA